jgi:hypothetical protein
MTSRTNWSSFVTATRPLEEEEELEGGGTRRRFELRLVVVFALVVVPLFLSAVLRLELFVLGWVLLCRRWGCGTGGIMSERLPPKSEAETASTVLLLRGRGGTVVDLVGSVVEG